MSLVAPSKPASCHISPAECQEVPGNAAAARWFRDSQVTAEVQLAKVTIGRRGGSDTEGLDARPFKGVVCDGWT